MGAASSIPASVPFPQRTEPRRPRRGRPAEALLKALPLFRAIEPAALERLARAAQRRPLRAGERVFGRGDVPTGFYVVVYGRIRLLGRGRHGERLAGTVNAGQSFGEPVLFLDRPALVDAEAATDALVLHLPREAVFAELESSPLFARRMVAGLSARLEALVMEREQHERRDGRARLADYLRRQAGEAVGHTFVLPATKAAVAAHLHLTPEHFSRLLHGMAQQGLLRVEGRRITVLQPQGLAASAR
ncbi:Crp/Fnr family transcriptional regulator [Ramlibacter alkalitolerans]|uniref:Crp/Fnr family transcriptional regulator n=1 Tax=Ramlibacter alkalitolerans TaxID=2039631 RepID=A0ABS1JIY8_9BURK|nr:Crp/Fnr family transcriptional regulator [Ramlibacter alkalitolerans]MBL0424195.1 Crp/Fnr family transcriptional regulator [Ramlibacter alkalitolerans]